MTKLLELNWRVLFAGLPLLAVCVPVLAQTSASLRRLTPQRAAELFGMRETVRQASLSPDGRMLATVEAFGARGSVLRVLDLADPKAKPAAILTSTGEPERMDWCRWSSNKRLVCQAFGLLGSKGTAEFGYVNRLVAVDADGSNIQMLRGPAKDFMSFDPDIRAGVIDWNTGRDGHVLILRRYYGIRDGLAVDDVDLDTLALQTREGPRFNGTAFISDGLGGIRIMGVGTNGSVLKRIDYSYRQKGQAEWRPLSAYDVQQGEGFWPHSVDPRLDLAYGLKKLDGRLAAYSVALDGSGKEQLVFAHPQVDVAGFVTIGRNQRLIGVRFVTDREEVFYFDEDFKRLADNLAKGMPQLPLIRFVDSSQDERKLLIWAGSDNDPGHYFLFDRDSRAMTELALTRVPLDRVPLGTVRPVGIPAADGVTIPAYLTLPPGSNGKNLPTIVMPHGGPSARDEWGFDWIAQYWASLGYAVLQPNFRGSAGYGDDWLKDNGYKSWATAIADVIRSGHWLVEQGIANPDRLAIFGWSYGGYAALQSAVTEPQLFHAVIAVAPVTDLGRLRDERTDRRTAVAYTKKIGGQKNVEEGSPARHTRRLMAPVLLFHGTDDRTVPYDQSQLMADRLRDAGKQGRLVTYDKLDHQLDDSAARQDMLSQSATFLEQSFAAGK